MQGEGNAVYMGAATLGNMMCNITGLLLNYFEIIFIITFTLFRLFAGIWFLVFFRHFY